MLKYKKALKIDNRTFIQYYISLIKRNQILFFTFYTKDDYNSKTIKFSLFIFEIAEYYAVNCLFLMIRLYIKFIRMKDHTTLFIKYLKYYILLLFL